MEILPTEIVQLVLDQLDPFSYHNVVAASTVLKTAGHDLSVLRRQVGRLPLSAVSRESLGSHDLESLAEARQRLAHNLLIGSHLERTTTPFQANCDESLAGKVALSKDGSRAVTLRNRLLTLYSLRSPEGEVEVRAISRRHLSDVRNPVRDGPTLRRASDDVFELALAQDSDLVAVALDRSVQLYDMANVQESPSAAYVSAAIGQYISGVDFDCRDAALRVRLSKDGTVLYLGKLGTAGDFVSWKADAGLRNLVLDSRNISFAGMPAIGVASIQLLDKNENGWDFVAQQRPTSGHQEFRDFENSYCVGRLPENSLSAPVHGAEGLEARFTTRLACGSPQTANEDAAYWYLQPSGDTEPMYCLSPDKELLILAEKCVQQDEERTRLFAWRLPRQQAADLSSDCDYKQPYMEAIRVPVFLGSVNGHLLAGECVAEASTKSGYRVKLAGRDMTFHDLHLSCI